MTGVCNPLFLLNVSVDTWGVKGTELCCKASVRFTLEEKERRQGDMMETDLCVSAVCFVCLLVHDV